MNSTIYATNQENITRLNEFEFIMFFKESIQDKTERKHLICVKPFTLRIRFHLNILDGKGNIDKQIFIINLLQVLV
jgi:hypothetical protein